MNSSEKYFCRLFFFCDHTLTLNVRRQKNTFYPQTKIQKKTFPHLVISLFISRRLCFSPFACLVLLAWGRLITVLVHRLAVITRCVWPHPSTRRSLGVLMADAGITSDVCAHRKWFWVNSSRVSSVFD